jgi:hypothetical protein
MHLEQYDQEFQIPIPFGSGFYYWTHTWIYDLDNPPVGDTSLGVIISTSHLGMLSNVRDERFQKTQPPYSGTPYAKFVNPGHPHALIPAGCCTPGFVAGTDFRSTGSTCPPWFTNGNGVMVLSGEPGTLLKYPRGAYEPA